MSTGIATITPSRNYFGEATIIVTGLSPSTHVTITVNGITVVGTVNTTDSSGNITTVITIPPSLTACSGCVYSVMVEDDDLNYATADFENCGKNKLADYIYGNPFSEIETLGDEIVGNPIDYIFHDGSHYVACQNTDYPDFTSFPPDTDWRPILIYKIDSDGTTTSFGVDTDFCWFFNDFSPESDPGCNWILGYFSFASWYKIGIDIRFGSDGTNLWLAASSIATIPYANISSDDGGFCDQFGAYTAPSQADQFVDFSTLTSGYTSFWDGSGSPPSGYERVIKTAESSPFVHNPDPPYSDSGDTNTGYWTIPRINVYLLSTTDATLIDSIDAEYYTGTMASGASRWGAGDIQRGGNFSRLFSGISVAASPEEEGVCHVVFSEAGAYGRVGGSGGEGEDTEAWDASQPNYGSRVNHSTWSTSAMTASSDVLSSTVDRTASFFPYDSDGSGVNNWGYSWPDPDMKWSNVFQVRNDNGSPVLFISLIQFTAADLPIDATDPDSHGNPWLDIDLDGYASTFVAYDLSTNTLMQDVDSALLPTLDEIQSIDTDATSTPDYLDLDIADDGYSGDINGDNFIDLEGLSIASWADPSLSDDLVYIIGTSYYSSADGNETTAFYRIPADLSADFDFLDGIRAVSYSILVKESGYTWFRPGTRRALVSDNRNVWAEWNADDPVSSIIGSPFQLDRSCYRVWFPVYINQTPYNSTTHKHVGACDGIYLDGYVAMGVNNFYAVGKYGSFDSGPYYLTKTPVNRGFSNCNCVGGVSQLLKVDPNGDVRTVAGEFSFIKIDPDGEVRAVNPGNFNLMRVDVNGNVTIV